MFLSKFYLSCCLLAIFLASIFASLSVEGSLSNKVFAQDARDRKRALENTHLYNKLSSAKECNANILKYFLRVLSKHQSVLKLQSPINLDSMGSLFYPVMLSLSSKCKKSLDIKYQQLEQKLDPTVKSKIDFLFNSEYNLSRFKDGEEILLDLLRRVPATWAEYDRLVEAKDESSLKKFLESFYEENIVVPCGKYRQHFEEWYYNARPLKYNMHESLVANFEATKYLEQLANCEFYIYQKDMIVPKILRENGFYVPTAYR